VSIDSVIGKGALVKDAVLLPGAIVKDGAKVINAIVGENSIIEEGIEFGSAEAGSDYAFCGNNVVIGKEE
jgi:glucose-1-phosphate adenylyltransferase